MTQGRTFEATAYTATCTGCSGITYAGIDVRHTIYSPKGKRIIAVDPTVIAIGSTVRITLASGQAFMALAADIGSAINGREIDLLVGKRGEALRFGRQDVRVEIINESGR